MLVFEPQMVKVSEIGLGEQIFMKMLEKSYSIVTVYIPRLVLDIVEQGNPILYA